MHHFQLQRESESSVAFYPHPSCSSDWVKGLSRFLPMRECKSHAAGEKQGIDRPTTCAIIMCRWGSRTSVRWMKGVFYLLLKGIVVTRDMLISGSWGKERPLLWTWELIGFPSLGHVATVWPRVLPFARGNAPPRKEWKALLCQ